MNPDQTKTKVQILKRYLQMVLVVIPALCSTQTLSQITVSGGTVATGSYTTFAAALTAVNANPATGAIVINFNNPGYSETAPAKGFVIGSTTLNPTLSAINTLSITRTSGVVTLYAGVGNAPFSGANPDGILVLIGTDYVTIDGLTLADTNTTNPATMEFGIGLFIASATNGCSNNTIKNCHIMLRRMNVPSNFISYGSVGIHSYNATRMNAANPVTINTSSGTNSTNKIYSNTIEDCQVGIVFSGNDATLIKDTGNDIGGTSAITGNTILNFGYPNTIYAGGILMFEQRDCRISFNTIDNYTGGALTSTGDIYGIKLVSFSFGLYCTINHNNILLNGDDDVYAITNYVNNPPSSGSIDINDNTVVVDCFDPGSNKDIEGIDIGSNAEICNINNNIFSFSTATTSGYITAIAGSLDVDTININNNNITNLICSAVSTSLDFIGISAYVYMSESHLLAQYNNIQGVSFAGNHNGYFGFMEIGGNSGTCNVRFNTLNNLTLHTSGEVSLFYFFNTDSVIFNVVNNSIVTGLTNTLLSSKKFSCIYHSSFSPVSNGVFAVDSNDFSNITVNCQDTSLLGVNSATGIYWVTEQGSTQSISSNTISNFTNLNSNGGALLGMYISGVANNLISGNTVSGLTGSGDVAGLIAGDTNSVNMELFGNIISDITSTSVGNNRFALGIQTGKSPGVGPSGTINISRNTICDISQTGSGDAVGLRIFKGATLNAYYNRIGGITSPNSNRFSVRGIEIASNSASDHINLYYNSLYLSGTSTAPGFGSAAVLFNTAPVSDVRNNLLINATTPTGSGLAVTHYRTGMDLSSYASTSDNNIWYGSTYYFDGTNTDAAFSAFKARVSPRDHSSLTEIPPFISAACGNTDYLKVQGTTPSLAESNGQNIPGYENDFNNNMVRTGYPQSGQLNGGGVAPDIGAFEYDGTFIAPVTVSGGTAGAGNYLTFYAALTAVNANPATGPITINFNFPGYLETAPPKGFVIGSTTLNPTLNSTNTLSITKSGGIVTLNAGVGNATPSSASLDGILALSGADFVTIDGLTLIDNNTTNPATMEFGIGFFIASATDGCSNNTIKNCFITLNRINVAIGYVAYGSSGIYSYNVTMTSANAPVTITTASGTNSNNRIYSNIIENCNTGIVFYGNDAGIIEETGNDIGGTSVATGNTILNFGHPTSLINTLGIGMYNQENSNISYNTINNNNGGGFNNEGELYGIQAGSFSFNTFCTISNNNLSLKANSDVYAIDNYMANPTLLGTIGINDNTIEVECFDPGYNDMYGIINNPVADVCNINNNSFSFSTPATIGDVIAIYMTHDLNILNTNYNDITHVNCSAASSSIYFAGIDIDGFTSHMQWFAMYNNIQDVSFSGGPDSYFSFIGNAGKYDTQTIQFNTLTNLNLNTSGVVRLFNVSNRTETVFIRNNSIVNGLTNAALSSKGFSCIYNSIANPMAYGLFVIENNNFSNITVNCQDTSILGNNPAEGIRWLIPGTGTFQNIVSNTISNFTNINPNGGALAGIYLSGTTYNNVGSNIISGLNGSGHVVGIVTANNVIQDIFSNTISGLTSTSAVNTRYAVGLQSGLSPGAGSSDTIYISRNTICGISNTGFGDAVGLRVYNGSVFGYYNRIGGITSPNSNRFSVRGIELLSNSGSDHINLYYNSLYLSGTSTASGFGSAAVLFNTAPICDIRNNVLINATTATGTGRAVAHYRLGTNLAGYASTSNNNIWYGSTYYYDGTNTDATFAAYKSRVATRDSASMTEISPFISTACGHTDYLKIVGTTPSAAESRAQSIPDYESDFNSGIIRTGYPKSGQLNGGGFAPDIGAYEYDGTYYCAVPPNNVATPPITGLPLAACNGTIVSISTPATPTATHYIWDGPPGCIFNGVGNPYTTVSASVSIQFGNPNGSGYYIGVQASNPCGTSVRKTQWVRGVVSSPETPSGITTTCANTTEIYTTGSVTGASQYLWTVTGNATVTGTDTSATVNFGPGWNGGSVCVSSQTSCYTSTAKCKTLTANIATSGLPLITGAQYICPGTIETYTINGGAGTDPNGYSWTLPAGTSGTSNTGTIQLTITSGFSTGNLCVTATSVCGVVTAPRCKSLVTNIPQTPSAITGHSTGLCGQTVTYTCTAVANATNYVWTLPPGATGSSTTNAIQVIYPSTGFTTSTLTVQSANACGNSGNRTISVKGPPNTPPAIFSSPAVWCNNDPVQFSSNTSVLAGFYTLSWSLSPATAGVIQNGQGTNSILVNWNTGNATVILTAANGCGSASRTFAATVSCREAGEDIQVSENSQFRIYPNPSEGLVNVEFVRSEAGMLSCRLTDMTGRSLASGSYSTDQGINVIKMHLNGIARGIYWLELGFGKELSRIKLVMR